MVQEILAKSQSFQGHPEFYREYLLNLIEKRLDRIGEETTLSANSSLNIKVDNEIIGQWMLNFLSQQKQEKG